MRKFAQQDVYTRFLLVLLVGMCINFVLECLLDLDLTLEDEKKKIDIVYTYASDLTYKF